MLDNVLYESGTAVVKGGPVRVDGDNDLIKAGDYALFIQGGMRYPAYVHQVVHEFDLLHCESGEVYAVICIFGEEFAINLGGPSIEGYEARLLAQGGLSPLYKPGELEALSRR